MFTETEGSALVPWPHSSVRYRIWFQKFPGGFSYLCFLFFLSPLPGCWYRMLQAAVVLSCSAQLPPFLEFCLENSESGLKMNLWEYFLPVSGVFEDLGLCTNYYDSLIK